MTVEEENIEGLANFIGTLPVRAKASKKADEDACGLASFSQALHNAVEGGRVELFRELLESGQDLSARNKENLTPAQLARRQIRENKHVEASQQILKLCDAKLNEIFWDEVGGKFKRQENELPIFYAIRQQDLEKVKLLADQGADLSVVITDNGNTPLHDVAAHQSVSGKRLLDLTKCLVENGADLNALNKAKRSPMFFAEGEPPIYPYLKKKLNAAFNAAVIDRDLEEAKRILMHNRAYLFDFNNPIILRAAKDPVTGVAFIQLLLENEISHLQTENAKQLTALHYAVLTNNLPVVKFLSERMETKKIRFSKTIDGKTALDVAWDQNATVEIKMTLLMAELKFWIYKEKIKKVNKRLAKLDQGHNFNSAQWSELIQSAINSIEESFIFKKKPKMIFIAVLQKYIEKCFGNADLVLTEEILANCIAIIEKYKIPCNFEMAKFLIDAKGKLTEVDKRNLLNWALLLADVEQSSKSVEFLLDKCNVNPNTLVGDGRIPAIFQAVQSNNLSVVQLLVDHGASVEAVDGMGITIWDCVKDLNSDVANYLKTQFHEGMSVHIPLFHAIARGNLIFIKPLIEADKQLVHVTDSADRTPIEKALMATERAHKYSQGDERISACFDIIVYLCQKGAVLNVHQQLVHELLFQGIRAGRLDVIKCILDNHFPIENYDEDALVNYAIQYPNEDIADVLRKASHKFYYAVLNKDFPAAQALVDAQVNKKTISNRDLKRSLFVSAEDPETGAEFIELMVKKLGANLRATNRDGQCPLDFALGKKNPALDRTINTLLFLELMHALEEGLEDVFNARIKLPQAKDLTVEQRSSLSAKARAQVENKNLLVRAKYENMLSILSPLAPNGFRPGSPVLVHQGGGNVVEARDLYSGMRLGLSYTKGE